MRPILSDVPVWLCRWPRGRSWYIPARSSASARDLCIMAGLGCPASIAYAGFSAAPGELRRPRGRPKATVSTGTSRRVEAALAIYSILRVDWPVGSILAGFDAERRWQASDSLLRDFVANVGRAIAALAATEREVLEQVVSTQGRASWHAARSSTSAAVSAPWSAGPRKGGTSGARLSSRRSTMRTAGSSFSTRPAGCGNAAPTPWPWER